MSAWEKEWWNLSRKVRNKVASIIGAGKDKEINILFEEIDAIFRKGEYKKSSQKIDHVT